MESIDFGAIISRMEEELQELEDKTENSLVRIISAVNLCASTYNQLRRLVLKHGFSTLDEEVNFFKVIKPHVYGKLLYYLEIYFIEAKRPVANLPLQREYFAGIQKKIQVFFEQYREFYFYYRSGSNLMDKLYFVRGQSDALLAEINTQVITYPEYNTSHDYVLSKFKAFEMVLQYIDQQIRELIRKEAESDKSQAAVIETGLFWTDNKVALVELVYALHRSGAINKGKLEIKQLSEVFETIFNIELGDLYRAFLEIRNRKKDRTKFIEVLKAALVKRMDDADNL